MKTQIAKIFGVIGFFSLVMLNINYSSAQCSTCPDKNYDLSWDNSVAEAQLSVSDYKSSDVANRGGPMIICPPFPETGRCHRWLMIGWISCCYYSGITVNNCEGQLCQL